MADQTKRRKRTDPTKQRTQQPQQAAERAPMTRQQPAPAQPQMALQAPQMAMPDQMPRMAQQRPMPPVPALQTAPGIDNASAPTLPDMGPAPVMQQRIGKEQLRKAVHTMNKYKAGKSHLERRIIDSQQWW